MNILDLAGLEAGHRQAHQLPAKAYAIGQGGAQLAVNQWLIRLAGSVGLRFCTRSRKAGAAFFLSSSAACLLVLRTRPIRVSMIHNSLRGRPAMIVLLAFTTRQLWRRTGSGVAGLNAASMRPQCGASAPRGAAGIGRTTHGRAIFQAPSWSTQPSFDQPSERWPCKSTSTKPRQNFQRCLTAPDDNDIRIS